MSKSPIATIGIDLGKNSFHVVGFDGRGAIVMRQERSRRQLETLLANMTPCLVRMEACAELTISVENSKLSVIKFD